MSSVEMFTQGAKRQESNLVCFTSWLWRKIKFYVWSKSSYLEVCRNIAYIMYNCIDLLETAVDCLVCDPVVL